MSRAVRVTVALIAAAAALGLASWFDGAVMKDARRQAQATFDMAGMMPLWTIGWLIVAGTVLLLGVLAWSARSAVVGIAYVIVGGFFAVLPWLWILGGSTNDAPPVMPEPFAGFVNGMFVTTAGPLNAVGTIGAGMAIAGIAALVRPLWERGAVPAQGPAPDVAAQPTGS